MEKVNSLSSASKGVWVSVLVWMFLIYLQVPTMMTRSYYNIFLGKKLAPPGYRFRPQVILQDEPRVFPSSTFDGILAEIEEEEKGGEEEDEMGPHLNEDDNISEEEEEEEEEEEDPCPQGRVLVVGAAGSVGSSATKMLLEQGFCVRLFVTDNHRQVKKKLQSLFDKNDNQTYFLEMVEGHFGDCSLDGALHSVTHILFAATSHGKSWQVGHHHEVAECAVAAAQVGTIQSMVVMSSAGVGKPYSLGSILYNSWYGDLSSVRNYQGEDTMGSIAVQKEDYVDVSCDDYDGASNQICTRRATAPLNYVILRSGSLEQDGIHDDEQQGIDGFGKTRTAPGMSHVQLARAAVAALIVQGRDADEVTRGEADPRESTALFNMLVQDNDSFYHANRTVTVKDVETVHAQAVADFLNILWALFVGTCLLVVILGAPQGLCLSMTLYIITILMWTWLLSGRTVWDSLESGFQPRSAPFIMKMPGLSLFMGIDQS
ncbi:expressed unknown protein [Seminavis robusta]|uniref:NAD(P)-binding domain-containing protein n=1 Tax=Seminavis robusta TaxID=568900 RepID=A0A9N8HPB3_9STRA|nr:expressed unknown protein [Seminavis robusta]|eukprot:Sro1055_g236030.1 n/a (487) ;mRNA; r:4393-5853